MEETITEYTAGPRWQNRIARRSVLVLSMLTVALTFGVVLLPLPVLVTPILAVLVPTIVAVGLIRLTGGFSQVRKELFGSGRWRFRLRWLLIPAGFYLAAWLGAYVVAFVLKIPVRLALQPLSPLHLLIFFIAAGEEIGWRGYALPRLLKSHSPLVASLLVGVPWAALHYAFMLPEEMLTGTPSVAHSLAIVSFSILLTWMYIRSNGNLLAVTLLHGWLNGPSLMVADSSVTLVWLSAAAWAGLAVLLLITGFDSEKAHVQPASR